MSQELLHCPRCEMAFDKYDRTPQMLPKCGHSMCMSCLREQCKVICPEDGLLQPQDLTLYPVNQAILRIISKSSPQNNVELGVCREHNKQLELVCLDDKCKICASCALFGVHRKHAIRNLDEVWSEVCRNAEELQLLTSQVQEKAKSLKLPQINKKIRDQIRLLIKQQQNIVEEQFKELLNQIMQRQRKALQDVELKYKSLEEQMIKVESQTVTSILEKADLWVMASQEKLSQYSTQKVTGDLSFNLLSQDTSNNQGKQIMSQLDDYMNCLQSRLSNINVPLPPMEIMDIQEPCVQQFFNEDPNILVDVSIMEQSILKDLDEKPPHNEFLGLSQPESTCQSQPSSDNFSQNGISPQKIEKRTPQPLISPKIFSRQSSMSPKKPTHKRKLSTKVESILLNCSGDYLDLSEKDLGDEGMPLLEEWIRNKKIKIVKLIRNRISDTGAQLLLQLHCQVLQLQSNVITERFLDVILHAIEKQTQIHIKTIYLEQNLINQFRCKKKIEELKRLGISIQL